MTMVSYGSPRGMKARAAGAQSGMGSIMRVGRPEAGVPVAGARQHVAGQGLPDVEDFTDEVVAVDRRPSPGGGSPDGLTQDAASRAHDEYRGPRETSDRTTH